MVAACFAMMAPSALAEETNPAQQITVTAQNIGDGKYLLDVTNNGSEDLTDVHGVTTVPQELTKLGLDPTYEWKTGELAAGKSAHAQRNGTDLVLTLKETAQQPAGGNAGNAGTAQGNNSSVDNAAAASSVSGKNAKNANDMHNAKQVLAATGSATLALGLVALAAVCIGAPLVSSNGTVRRRVIGTTAGVVSLAVALALVAPGAQKASAAEVNAEAKNVPTTLTYRNTDYTLTSDITVSYEKVDANTLNSVEYAKAMGAGWNLGNQFDGEDTDLSKPDTGEEAWGNPKITRELIHSVKEQGYSNIRIPMTVDRRSTQGADGHWTIDANWLKRYKEVVDWAVDEGLYVMINVHHDSWIWLKNWNGDTSASEYTRFTDYWKQLSQYFANDSGKICFETINEPQFAEGTDEQKQTKLDTLNKAAYSIIRGTKGNETRMIVIATMNTGAEDFKLEATQKFISNLNDPYVMATVHYYSEWVFSANLGKTRFDETIFGDPSYTPRTAIDQLMNKLDAHFSANNIGVCIGEFGLLAYDSASDDALQSGEELKYYEYVAYQANQHGYSYDFWDNGSGIDRTNPNYTWKKPAVGATLAQAALKGRSSYTKGLNTLFYETAPTEDAKLPLELNGNTFQGIDGLTEGTDYTYDDASATLTLTRDYLTRVYNAKGADGICADLQLKFSAGPAWNQYIVRVTQPAASRASASGTRADGIAIPVDFNGNEVMSITAMQDGQRVVPNSSWWNWLQNGEAFQIKYDSADRVHGTITMRSSFFNDASVKDGTVTLEVTFQNGMTLSIPFTIAGSAVSYGN